MVSHLLHFDAVDVFEDTGNRLDPVGHAVAVVVGRADRISAGRRVVYGEVPADGGAGLLVAERGAREVLGQHLLGGRLEPAPVLFQLPEEPGTAPFGVRRLGLDRVQRLGDARLVAEPGKVIVVEIRSPSERREEQCRAERRCEEFVCH